MTTNPHNLKPGMALWYVPIRRNGDPMEVVIESVGRKWAQVTPSWIPRLNLETLAMDGGGYQCPGHCYLSRQAYESKAALDAAWSDFRLEVSNLYNPARDSITLEGIQAARRALHLELEVAP